MTIIKTQKIFTLFHVYYFFLYSYISYFAFFCCCYLCFCIILVLFTLWYTYSGRKLDWIVVYTFHFYIYLSLVKSKTLSIKNHLLTNLWKKSTISYILYVKALKWRKKDPIQRTKNNSHNRKIATNSQESTTNTYINVKKILRYKAQVNNR